MNTDTVTRAVHELYSVDSKSSEKSKDLKDLFLWFSDVSESVLSSEFTGVQSRVVSYVMSEPLYVEESQLTCTPCAHNPEIGSMRTLVGAGISFAIIIRSVDGTGDRPVTDA